MMILTLSSTEDSSDSVKLMNALSGLSVIEITSYSSGNIGSTLQPGAEVPERKYNSFFTQKKYHHTDFG